MITVKNSHLTCISWRVVKHNRLEHHEVLDGFANTHLNLNNNFKIFQYFHVQCKVLHIHMPLKSTIAHLLNDGTKLNFIFFSKII